MRQHGNYHLHISRYYSTQRHKGVTANSHLGRIDARRRQLRRAREGNRGGLPWFGKGKNNRNRKKAVLNTIGITIDINDNRTNYEKRYHRLSFERIRLI